MLKLQNDGKAGIGFAEEPRNVVNRLARLDSKGSELADLLTSVEPKRLRELGKQAKAALKRLGPSGGGSTEKARRPQVVTRRRIFGD